MPNFMFCEGCKQAMTKFILFMYLDMVDRNSAPEEFACMIAFDKVSELHRNSKKVNSFFHATISWLSAVVVSFKNSLIFAQDVTDASVNTCRKLKLVFMENRLLFSGRQYFEIRRGFYIKLKVSWLRAFLWCMSQTSLDRKNNRRVRTHEKNLGETVRRLGTIIQSSFCAQSGAGIRLKFWK